MSKFEDELSLGRLAVRMGFCTDAHVQESLTEQRHREVRGRFDHIGTIMVERGVITRPQLERLLAVQEEGGQGQTVSGYEIIKEIGRGAMGVVYRARQLSLDREVALKLIPKGAQTDQAFKDRFLREAKSAALLSHPNIIKAIDAGEGREVFYFAMELFLAPNLHRIVKKNGPIPEKTLLPIAVQITSALQHAHENQLVHRDIKPENILYRADQALSKLTDLGLARSTRPDEKRLTQTGATMGTPYYISPEAVQGRTDIDIRADIYSLGATLYHLATGRPPFDAETSFLVLRMHLDTPLVPPRQLHPQISDTLSQIICRMMRKDPRKRFQTPAELQADLERLRDFGPKAAHARPSRTRMRARRGAKPWAPLAAVAGILVLAAAGWFLLRGSDPPPAPDGGPSDDRPPAHAPPQTDPHERDPAPEPLPPDTGGTPPSAEARRAFEEAVRWAETHAGEPAAAAERFEALARRFPAIGGPALERAAMFRARAGTRSLQDVLSEADGLAAKKKFGPAIRILHAFPLQTAVPPDVEASIRERCDSLLAQAKTEARTRERLARSRAAAGDVEAAVTLLKEILEFEIAELVPATEKKIRELRVQGEIVKILLEHLAVLDLAAAHGLGGALERLPEGPDAGTERRNLRAALSALEGAVAALREGGDEPSRLRLRDGSLLEARIHSATDREITLDAGGTLEGLPWTRVSLETVEALGGDGASGTALACLAWYLHRDAPRALEALERVLVDDPFKQGLKDTIRGALGMLLDRGLDEAQEALQRGQRPEAQRILLDLVRDFRDTEPFTAREADLRAALSQAAGGSWEDTILPFLFRGEARRAGSGVRIAYDFVRACQFQDFKDETPPGFIVREGRFEPRSPPREDAALSWPGRWTRFEAAVALELPEGGGARIVLEGPDGRGRFLDLRRLQDRVEASFRRRMPDDRVWTLRTLAAVRPGDRALSVAFGLEGGEIWARVGDGRKEKIRETAEGTFLLGIVPLGPFAVTALTLEGLPEPGWVEGLKSWEAHQAAFLEGQSLDLTERLPAERWRRSGGRVRFEGKTVHLEGNADETRLWVAEAEALLAGSAAYSLHVELRRASDRGHFFLLVPTGGKTVGWLVVPEREEEKPPGSPADYPVLSTAPFADGSWHTVRVEVKGDTTTLYVDGAIREVFTEVASLGGAIFKTRGLGFGAFGGRWEIRSFRLRKGE